MTRGRLGNRYGLLPRGDTVKLNEAHIIFSCPAAANQTLGLGLSDFKDVAINKRLSMYLEILPVYVGSDNAPVHSLMERGRKLGVKMLAGCYSQGLNSLPAGECSNNVFNTYF